AGEWPIPVTLRVQYIPDDADQVAAAELLQRFALTLCGRALLLTPTAVGAIRLRRVAAREGASDEAYRLRIMPGELGSLDVEAATRAGLLRAASSAAQLLCWPGRTRLPALQIDDAPQFRWRGAMLDSARHFQSV